VTSIQADDGFVAYLNGTEVGRLRAGEPGTPIPFDGVATSVAREPLQESVVALPEDLLRASQNQLAPEGLNASTESSDLSLIPVLLIGPRPLPDPQKDPGLFDCGGELAALVRDEILEGGADTSDGSAEK
jgi:hypothetical protein